MISELEADGLAVERGGRLLFENLSFRVAPGEALLLTGPNGAGKTSLLRCLAGLLRPSAGAVRFGASDAREARARGLHWLGADDGLKASRTAAAELRFWARWGGGETVDASLDAVGLRDAAETPVRRLSAGQRRRLAFSRLLEPRRPLWLLDEPLAPLDPSWRDWAAKLMGEHLEAGGLLVAAVHDRPPIPARELRLESAA
ncbi:MAG: heme ABC exporter ATP-binding protein CcmA [Pseudomonadota bacterium]|nr:heme ABC exporter ATP-binding protein CcmA [Pseudomonadota bacterium]